MTDMKYILYSLLVGMMMVSCSSADDIADDANSQQAAQQVDLLVSVGSNSSQSNKLSASALRRAATFQEMEGLVAIPFHTDGAAVAPTDHPYLDMVRTTEESSRVEGHNNYYVDHCFLMPGTDRMLVYGKSKPSPSADQTVNGHRPHKTGRHTLQPVIHPSYDRGTYRCSGIGRLYDQHCQQHRVEHHRGCHAEELLYGFYPCHR